MKQPKARLDMHVNLTTRVLVDEFCAKNQETIVSLVERAVRAQIEEEDLELYQEMIDKELASYGV